MVLGAIALALAGLLLGCERERQVPYIAPTLANWARPYKGVKGLHLHVFQVGAIRQLEGLVLRQGSMIRRRDLPIFAYVLQHPTQGAVVINPGLNRGLADDGERYFSGFEGLGMTADLDTGQDLPSQMRAAGIKLETVRWVFLSTLQFAHAGEAEAFPEARVVASRAEHAQAREGGRGYVDREFDTIQSWKLVDPSEGQPVGTFRAALDLFGDGSCLLIDARGPTAGHVAFLLRLPTQPVLLAGALAPVSESVRYAAAPRFVADMDDWWDRIWRLKRFQYLEPALIVVPDHDAGPLRDSKLPEVEWHDFTPAEQPASKSRQKNAEATAATSTPARTPSSR